ncbi:MAG: class I SAM-dependent methyltransferase [Betaproteobacteria bacterium]|nr:MAG: class I SAM-dependent methyltransferase [Betaproteobacteria bacterium]
MRADRPSSTAALIAAATVFLSRDRALARFVPAGAAEICARCLTAPQLLSTRRGLRWLALAAERATIPGLLLHFMLRKRWIEQAVRGAIARGARRVVVVGAGYDTLAARLAPEFPGVRFIEVDHPATQAVKRVAVPSATRCRPRVSGACSSPRGCSCTSRPVKSTRCSPRSATKSCSR